MIAAEDTNVTGRNLVVCCDGTDNEFGEDNSNILRLFSVALKDTSKQIVFYDPGLGTFPAPGAVTPLMQKITKIFGSAFGYGLSQNMADSYRLLMENYVPGDRIYLFGFSRGAYTVRALASLIHVCGLMYPTNRNLIPYAINLFKDESSRAKKKAEREEQRSGERQRLELPVCSHFKEVFSISPEIHFIGLWDTVSSVGTIYDPFNLPYTQWNPSVKTVRHAISIDEQRKFFRTNLWSASTQDTDVKQVWFAGVHADIGGGYTEKTSGLGKITLSWMLEEARSAQLLIDSSKVPSVLPPSGAATSLSSPDPSAPMHNELDHFRWKLFQWIPRRHWVRDTITGKYVLKWNFSPRRTPRHIEDGSRIHNTVFKRMQNDHMYRPVNLPDKVCDENNIPVDWRQLPGIL